MTTANTFMQKLANKGITVKGAAKMPVITGKPAVTLASATKQVLDNLKLNKAAWVAGNAKTAIEGKQRNWKEIDGVYSIGLKFGIRYVPDVFGEGMKVDNKDTKAEFLAMFDELIEGVEAGMLDDNIRAAMAANATMRKAH